ncbi:hypothetical protein KRMM14A1259_56460 [Krasilnikovia sp. MM14-A1259]
MLIADEAYAGAANDYLVAAAEMEDGTQVDDDPKAEAGNGGWVCQRDSRAMSTSTWRSTPKEGRRGGHPSRGRWASTCTTFGTRAARGSKITDPSGTLVARKAG